jgi:hypothetical protein
VALRLMLTCVKIRAQFVAIRRIIHEKPKFVVRLYNLAPKNFERGHLEHS